MTRQELIDEWRIRQGELKVLGQVTLSYNEFIGLLAETLLNLLEEEASGGAHRSGRTHRRE